MSAAGQITGIAAFARLDRPSGQAYVAVPADRLAKALSYGLSLGPVLSQAVTAAGEAIPDGKLVAILGIGFGPSLGDGSVWPLWKGRFNEDDHPRWPAGMSGGRGGQFRAKDKDTNEDEPDARESGALASETREQLLARLRRLAMRRAIRSGLLLLLRTGGASLSELVPVLGQAIGALLAADALATAADLYRLKVEYDAALEFAKAGPRTLQQLRVTGQRMGFETFDAFKKSPVEKFFGSAGYGYEYHHVIEQGGDNAKNIPPEQLHNTELIVRIPTLLHEAVSAEYSRTKEGTGMTVREWLQKQPFEVQREEGLKILRKLGILQ